MLQFNTEFDNEFSKEEKLKWLPWIGSNFGKEEQLSKILIVGESHYLQRGNDVSKYEESKKKHSDPNFTREIISEMQRNEYKLKIFNNLNAIFQCQSDLEIHNFYSKIAFYNFIQEPVENIKIRPTDFRNDWKAFKAIVKTIEPDICIFVGTQALKTLKDNRDKIDLDIEMLRFIPKIDNTFPGMLSFHLNGKKINCLAIKHTSRVFKPMEWTKLISHTLFIDLKKLH